MKTGLCPGGGHQAGVGAQRPLHARGEAPQGNHRDEDGTVPSGEGAQQDRDGQFHGTGDHQRHPAAGTALQRDRTGDHAAAQRPHRCRAGTPRHSDRSHRQNADQAPDHRTGVRGVEPEGIGCLSTCVHLTILARNRPSVGQPPTRGAHSAPARS
ncbi:hypothetical protein [Mycolicibacterium alvei]|uniref:hypothetical protein n=1 Tax=Mycolicibacterium alvei TaxID=67081 RepID=UPI00355887EF